MSGFLGGAKPDRAANSVSAGVASRSWVRSGVAMPVLHQQPRHSIHACQGLEVTVARKQRCYELGMCGVSRWFSESDIVDMGRGMFPELVYQFPWLFEDSDKSWFGKEERKSARFHNNHRPRWRHLSTEATK